ncbi:MAG: AsmA family protein, partial [Woeseiaceae bacterium]
MNRPVKIFLWLIAAIAVLFVIAAIMFFLLFDPNDFRDDVEQAVEEATGRETTIGGDVSLKLFPWLAVQLGETRLGNAPGFGDEPFAAFDDVTLSVQILPLILERKVMVGTAEINGLQLNLAVKADGTDNWSDLGATQDSTVVTDAASGDEQPGTTSAELAVSGIAIRNATITYTSGPDRFSLSEADFTVGPVTGDQDALSIGPVAFEALISGLTEIPTQLAFGTDGIEIDIPGNVATLQPVNLSILGIDMHAEFEPVAYGGAPDARATLRVETFSPRSLMTQLGIEPPQTTDPGALSELSIAATVAIGESSANLSGVTVVVDDTTFTGAMTVPLEDSGRLSVQLEGDAIDLDRYMAVADEAAAGAAEDVPPVEIPVDLIKPLNAQGSLKIGSVQVAGIELENVTLGLDAANGRMRINPIAAGLYGGQYSGDVRVDVSGATPALSFDEKIDGVDLGELARAMFEQENVTGTVSGRFNLGGRGGDMNEIRETLDGNVSFELVDGTYEGTDIWWELRRARALLRQEEPPEPTLPARTRFTSVTASGQVTDGVLTSDDLRAELPFMQLTGSGDVDLNEGTV